MKDPLVLAFDMGTQSVRSLLIDPVGTILFKAQKDYAEPYYSKRPGGAEQKAQFYWESLAETSRTLKEKAGVLWDDIIAVTCATIRDTCVCLDKNNEPVRDAIVWVDDRTVNDLPPLPAAFQAFLKLSMLEDKVDLQRRKSHCNWIAVYEKEVWEKTRTFAMISTWLNFKFTGNLLDSNASMRGHLPFDNKRRTWMKQSDLRRIIFVVKDDRLFDLVDPGTVLGTITPQAAEETGIKAGLPLIATGSDKGCETLGLSCLSEEKAALSFGTTATVQVSTRHYFDPIPNMPAYAAVVPGYFNPEAQIYRGYWLLSWFKREFAAKENAQAEKIGVSTEKLLDDRLKEIRPGCDGLIFQPYFTPVFTMPHAKGAVIGFSDSHTRMHLYRAIIEGLNFALMQGLETLQKRGKLTTKKIFVAGGGARSDEVCQITASQFGIPVYRTQTHEACGIGEALCAFVSKGIFSSYEEGLQHMVHVKDEFLPDKNDHAVYRELYERIFVKVFSKLSPLYQEINEIIRR
ncbi:MAG: FGGY-family carbohydrate kinase [Treponema sp.]|jgi:sugar (pentulose or hexulose) kinase|nr:FGGY-family carbohydrate kinase [Treponema sp.]